MSDTDPTDPNENSEGSTRSQANLPEALPNANAEQKVYRSAFIVITLGALAIAGLLANQEPTLIREARADNIHEEKISPAALKEDIPTFIEAAAQTKRNTPRLDQRVERCGPTQATLQSDQRWATSHKLSLGNLFIPSFKSDAQSLNYDLLIHFHAHKTAKNLAERWADNLAFVGVDLGTHTGNYARPFITGDEFPELLSAVEEALKPHAAGKTLMRKRIILSGWSAGVGAIMTLLKRYPNDVDAAILLDGLHAGWKLNKPTDGTQASVEPAYLAPLTQFAKRALSGEKQLIITHSDVPTEGYAPTRITSDKLLSLLDLRRQHLDPSEDLFGRWSEVSSSGFTLWGHLGSEERGHCAQLILLQDALQALLPRD